MAAHLGSVKRPDTEISINDVDDGSMDLHHNTIVAMSSLVPDSVLNKMIQAEAKGHNAIAIGCFLDPEGIGRLDADLQFPHWATTPFLNKLR